MPRKGESRGADIRFLASLRRTIVNVCHFPAHPAEVSRNDSCLDLPEIQNGWKTTSHTELVREAKITYQCDPGYDIIGSDTLTCQWDLTWSSDPPFCEKSTD